MNMNKKIMLVAVIAAIVVVGTVAAATVVMRREEPQGSQNGLSTMQVVNSPQNTERVDQAKRYYDLPRCFSYQSKEDFKSAFASTYFGDVTVVDSLFSDPQFLNWFEVSDYSKQICLTDRQEAAFIIYGQYDQVGDDVNNNLIGLFTEGKKLITNQQYNAGGGDIGLCRIDGFIERNVIYSCGGGDGPCGHNTTFVLDRSSGESKVIKQCEGCNDPGSKGWECSVNELDLPVYGF